MVIGPNRSEYALAARPNAYRWSTAGGMGFVGNDNRASYQAPRQKSYLRTMPLPSRRSVYALGSMLAATVRQRIAPHTANGPEVRRLSQAMSREMQQSRDRMKTHPKLQ